MQGRSSLQLASTESITLLVYQTVTHLQMSQSAETVKLSKLVM